MWVDVHLPAHVGRETLWSEVCIGRFSQADFTVCNGIKTEG